MGAPQNVGKLVCVLRPRVRGEESGNVCLGSKTDVAAPICDVCFSPQQQTLIGHACTSALDLGCVKTCPREQRAELFSLLSILDSAHQHCYFFNLQKSRQTFYPQIQFRSFHTAKTHKRHQCLDVGAFFCVSFCSACCFRAVFMALKPASVADSVPLRTPTRRPENFSPCVSLVRLSPMGSSRK